MHKKSLFFGMGIGILAMVAISFFTYVVQRSAHLNAIDELRGRLEASEMAYATPPEINPVDIYFIVDRARDLGMVFPDEIEPEIIYYFLPPEEAANVDYNGYDYDPADPDEPYEEVYEPYEEAYEPYVPYEAYEPYEPQQPTARYVSMNIRPGLTASEAAYYFELMGMVESALEFEQFLVERGYQTSVLAGHHIVPRGASFQEIVDIIVHGNRR